ncbi:MAG: NAD(P)-binding domain-containing protein [Candidatus Carsonella ruddii]
MINHIGIIGYGIMSKNISYNLIKKKIKISIYNKEKLKIKLKFYNILIITNCLKKFLKSLPKIKLIFILIKTGKPIKIVILKLKKNLSIKDIVIDFGNSFYKNSFINNNIIKNKFIFICSGISGGSDGALNGLCCMIDFNIKILFKINNIIKKIVFNKKKRFSFCLSIGFSSSHFIKMIHNGIEYGILQLISEIYFLIKKILINKKKIINIFINWNKTDLNSYLLKILLNIILKKKNKILDIIDHKGTGMNCVISCIKKNININSIFEALIIRIISKDIFYRNIIKKNNFIKIFLNLSLLFEIIKNCFFICKLLSYIQGINSIIKNFKKYNWKLNFNNLIKSYFNSCIISSKILFYLLFLNKNFFLTFFFINYIKKYNFIKKKCLIFINLNISFLYIFSCLNFINLIIYKNYNFKIIQFERNYFGNHKLNYI